MASSWVTILIPIPDGLRRYYFYFLRLNLLNLFIANYLTGFYYKGIYYEFKANSNVEKGNKLHNFILHKLP